MKTTALLCLFVLRPRGTHKRIKCRFISIHSFTGLLSGVYKLPARPECRTLIVPICRSNGGRNQRRFTRFTRTTVSDSTMSLRRTSIKKVCSSANMIITDAPSITLYIKQYNGNNKRCFRCRYESKTLGVAFTVTRGRGNSISPRPLHQRIESASFDSGGQSVNATDER